MLYSINATITTIPKDFFVEKMVKMIPLEKMYYSTNPYTTAIRKATSTITCTAVSAESGTAFFNCTFASGGGVLRKNEIVEVVRSGVTVGQATIVENGATSAKIMLLSAGYTPENSDVLRYMGDTVIEPETENTCIYFKGDKDIFLQTDSASPSTDNLIIKPFFFEW